MSGENCTSSCLTRDHSSWGECMRAKSLHVAYCAEHKGADYTRQKKWDAELGEYHAAKKAGVSPAGTTMPKIREAYAAADAARSKPVE